MSKSVQVINKVVVKNVVSQNVVSQNVASHRIHPVQVWAVLLGVVAGPVASGSAAFSQPTAPPIQPLSATNCDATVLPLATPNAQPNAVDLGGAPTEKPAATKPSSKAVDLGDFAKLPAPSKEIQVPKDAADVTLNPAQPLTLEQAIELARLRDRDLQIAAITVDQQKSALKQVRAAIYPTVTAQAGITRTDSPQAAIAAKQLGINIPRPNARNDFNGSVDLNYDVFTSGQRPASIRAAEAALKSSEKAYQTQFQQVRLDIANDYYDLQQADELVRIAKQAVETAEENLRVTQAKETAGIGTRFETLQASVSLADRKQQLVQAQSQQKTAQRQIAQRLSLPDTVAVTATDSVAMLGEWTPKLENSIVQALQNRTELAQILEQRKIAQQNRKVALGSLGPQLSFSASAAVADDLNDSNLGAYGYSVGAQASKTIFDGGSAKAIAAQQNANTAIAETQFASFKNLIRFQIEQNYYTLKSSRERILTTRCAIEQAKQGLNLAKLRRDYGVGTSLEVSNATVDLAQAENNYLTAIVDYNRAFSALQRFVGQTAEAKPE